LASRLFTSARAATARGASRAKRFGDALPRAIAEKRGDVRPPARRPQRRQTSPRVPLEARSQPPTQLVIGIGVLCAVLFLIGLLVKGDEPSDTATETAGAASSATTSSGDAPIEVSARAYGAADVPNAMIFDLVLESAATQLEGSEIEDGVLLRIPSGRS